jgi:K+-sensing histidine kinase KdpD
MPPQGRGKYLAFVAHEIKNPLATALWSSDLLKRMDAADRAGDRADKMIDVSLRALRRMRRLVDDFFTIERLREGGYELRREKHALRDLVAAAVQQLTEKDGFACEVAVEAGQGEVVGDPDMLKRALKCLVEYMARPAEKETPRLTVTAPSPSELQLAAEKPPSPLIPPSAEERPSGDPLGAVLGYALAARILEAHKARIEERDGGLRIVFG